MTDSVTPALEAPKSEPTAVDTIATLTATAGAALIDWHRSSVARCTFHGLVRQDVDTVAGSARCVQCASLRDWEAAAYRSVVELAGKLAAAVDRA